MTRLSPLVVLSVHCVAAFGASSPFLKLVLVTHVDALFLKLAFSVSTAPGQAIVGIGASGAWWPNDLFNYPESVREQVAETLFGASGAGLTSYRYNVGGGGVFVGNPTYVHTCHISRLSTVI